jgi:hypothetical protein
MIHVRGTLELKIFWVTKGHHTRPGTIFLLTILIIMSVASISIAPQNTQADLISDLCKTYGIGCTTTTSPTGSSTSGKFFLATFLQYVNKDSQVNIYKPNMGTEDMTRLRATNGALKSDYVQSSLSLPGPAGVSFISSQQIINNAKKVKDLGFTYVEFNLEPGLSPDSDNNNVVGAMKNAAQAAHQQGLKFLAAPSRAYTTNYGSQIAPFSDYYHIQAQSLQQKGVKAYSDYVHTIVPKLKQANSNVKITVQVSTQAGSAPGLSLLDTLKQCTESVMDVVHGISPWFGNPDLSTLKSFTQWYNSKY